MTDPDAHPHETLSIASELISARTERGFSQAHLSEVSGISRSAIKAYETGRNMPGSRELRALCVALKVTPNKLLFGSEAPVFEEGQAALIDAASRSIPGARAFSRIRLAVISDLLTAEETDALTTLARSIATARHGPEKVKEAVLAGDLLASLSRSMMVESVTLLKTGEQAVDPARFMSEFEASMKREGHLVEPGDGS